MTKQRHCFVAQVGDAIEALASALDPEREPPFKGDILDLLEWAEKDVLELRQKLTASINEGLQLQLVVDDVRNEYAEAMRSMEKKLRQQVTLLQEILGYWMCFIESEQDDEKQAPWVRKAQEALAATKQN